MFKEFSGGVRIPIFGEMKERSLSFEFGHIKNNFHGNFLEACEIVLQKFDKGIIFT